MDGEWKIYKRSTVICCTPSILETEQIFCIYTNTEEHSAISHSKLSHILITSGISMRGYQIEYYLELVIERKYNIS
jgi:hypothetical protein